MKRTVWRWLVISGCLLAVVRADAATRPSYGGVLRIATHSAPLSLDPAESALPDDEEFRNRIWPLISDTLVALDQHGAAIPDLAASWDSSSDARRWQFHLRKNVRFNDGEVLTAEAVASWLRAIHSHWRIDPVAEGIVIQTEQSEPNLLKELALPRNGILKKDPAGKLMGTGPFVISDFQPGRKLTLTAAENSWSGRAFLDAIEVEFGKNYRDQAIAVDLGRTDLAEVPAEQVRRALSDGRHVVEAAPNTLLALLFSREAQSESETQARRTLANVIDRDAIRNVLFQGHAVSAFSALPNSMTGYAFLMKQRMGEASVKSASGAGWTISYGTSDPMERVIAERIALNARDAGITLQLSPGNPKADLRLVRFSLFSSSAGLSLENLAARLDVQLPTGKNSSEELYLAERKLLDSGRLIPVLHVPHAYVLGSAVRDWHTSTFGDWKLEDIWLEAGKK